MISRLRYGWVYAKSRRNWRASALNSSQIESRRRVQIEARGLGAEGSGGTGRAMASSPCRDEC
jgi:hypothetical protein